MQDLALGERKELEEAENYVKNCTVYALYRVLYAIMKLRMGREGM
jgi:hypothetical protein